MIGKAMREYPELEWLKGDVNVTPEGANKTVDPDLEFKKTILSIKLLKYVISNDYEKFTKCQQPKRLSRKKFKEICKYTKEIIKSKEDLEAICTYLIINDLGKIKRVVSRIENQIGLQTVDHDDILYQGLANIPGISPSFDKLDDKYKKIILNGLRTKFNMGQFIFSENFPKNLEPLVNLDKKSFDYYMLHVLFDIGGAVIDKQNRKGSTIIDDSYWEKFKKAEEYLKQMNSIADIGPTYLRYIDDIMGVLELENTNPCSIATTKICNMLKITDSTEAQIVLQTLQSQEPNVRAILEQELTATGIDDDKAILLYYAPATMRNAITYFKNNNSENPIVDGLNIVLPTFARIYSQTRANLAKKDDAPNVTTVMISNIAKKAGENPNELSKSNIELQSVGNDFEASISPVHQINNTQSTKFPRGSGR